MEKKKRRTGLYIFLVILFLLAAVIIAAVVHFYPIWRAAKDMEEKLDFARFSYVMDVELEERELTDEQRDLIGTLAAMTGLEQKDFMQMHIEGSVWDDKVYAEITPTGTEAFTVELYLSDKADLINAGPVYNKIRQGLVEEYALLDYFLPAPAGDVYMTLEQAEQLSGEDLRGVKDFEPSFSQYNMPAAAYFVILTVLQGYAKGEDEALILEEVKEPVEGQEMRVSLHLAAEQPGKIAGRFLEKYADRLSSLGVSPNAAAGLEVLKKIEVRLTSEGVQEPVMPENILDSNLPRLVEDVRRLLDDILKLPDELREKALEEYVRLQQM